MELKGLVKQVGPMRYIAVYEQGIEYRLDAPMEPNEG